jgi:hypothetical protein
MSLRLAAKLFLTVGLVCAIPIACGSSDSHDYHCCINGSYYQCPDSDSLKLCVKSPGSCVADSAKDSTCAPN